MFELQVVVELEALRGTQAGCLLARDQFGDASTVVSQGRRDVIGQGM
jgi:hypothetical protein